MKMKIYDKEMYKRNETIKDAILVLFIFLVGYAVGCLAINEDLKIQNQEKQEHIVELENIVEQQEVKINEQYIELDSLRESVYMLQMYGK